MSEGLGPHSLVRRFAPAISHSPILSLGTGAGGYGLTLGGPRHKIVTQEDCIA
jgi:hypothetical protein